MRRGVQRIQLRLRHGSKVRMEVRGFRNDKHYGGVYILHTRTLSVLKNCTRESVRKFSCLDAISVDILVPAFFTDAMTVQR